MNDLKGEVRSIKTELSQLHKDIQKLLTILLESDRSIVSRMAVAESKIISFEEKSIQMENNSMGVKIAMVSALLGLCASIAIAMIEFWGHK